MVQRVVAGIAVALFSAPLAAQCGSPQAGSCFEPRATPFCSNAVCCQLVCAADPFCCASAWDALCVEAAFFQCLGCGDPASGSCFSAPHPPGCDDAACCTLVCTADPFCCTSQWDSICRAAAEASCASGACGGAQAGDCFEARTTPFCADAGCCAAVCGADPFCCATAWDEFCVLAAVELCADCGLPSAGSCFEARTTPACAIAECCLAVCSFDPFCCGAAWDELCALAAADICLGCGDPGAGSCHAVHSLPSCGDILCCTIVCAADPFCCQITWDEACVAAANAGCEPFPSICGDPVAGECFLPHGTPYCDHAGCCLEVCAIDPFCCAAWWDEICAATAIAYCTLDCGSPVAGSCFVAGIEPFCDQFECCAAVCDADPFCCDVMWDATCVGGAFAFCLGCGDPAAGSCFTQHSWPSCADAACCAAVCGPDPFCCLVQWDLACKQAAFVACLGCGASDTGSCLAGREEPSCDLASCCAEVCRYDLFCCAVAWDGVCVALALELCAFPLCYGGCPGDLDADALVGATDLARLLGNWGGTGCGDIDDDGAVGASDLAVLLGAWGACP